MVLLLRKLYMLILYQGSRGGPLFLGEGGGSNFSQEGWGVRMLISIETHITCDFLGGGGPDPLSPSGSARGNVVIKGQYLSQSRFLP